MLRRHFRAAAAGRRNDEDQPADDSEDESAGMEDAHKRAALLSRGLHGEPRRVVGRLSARLRRPVARIVAVSDSAAAARGRGCEGVALFVVEPDERNNAARRADVKPQRRRAIAACLWP